MCNYELNVYHMDRRSIISETRIRCSTKNIIISYDIFIFRRKWKYLFWLQVTHCRVLNLM